MPFHKVKSLRQLSEAECCNEEGSLPVTFHRLDSRPFDRIELLVLLGWILGLEPYYDSSK